MVTDKGLKLAKTRITGTDESCTVRAGTCITKSKQCQI